MKRPDRPSMQVMFDRMAPHSLEAEMSCLGSIIVSGDASSVAVARRILGGSEAFYGDAHQAIFEALCKVADAGDALDLVLLSETMKDDGDYERVGGLDYLLNLAQSVPSAASLEYYAGIVRQKADYRNLIDIAGDLVYAAYHPSDEVEAEQIATAYADRLDGMKNREAGSTRVVTIADAARRVVSDIREGKPDNAIPTGFLTLDEYLDGGVRPGEMMLIAARPSQGKTAMGMNIVENAWRQHQKRAVFVSAEMDPESLAKRLMGAGIKHADPVIRKANAEQALKRLESMDVPIIDLSNTSLTDATSHVRTLARERRAEMIVLDYIQLLDVDGVTRPYERVTAASKAMKRMARAYNLPLICLAQINREGGKAELPKTEHLKDSGALEQDADQIVLLYNPINDPDAEYAPHMNLAKHRNGKTGRIALKYDGPEFRFHDEGPYTLERINDDKPRGMRTRSKPEPAAQQESHWTDAMELPQ